MKSNTIVNKAQSFSIIFPFHRRKSSFVMLLIMPANKFNKNYSRHQNWNPAKVFCSIAKSELEN